jgi:rod shape-determining protein MreD
MNIQWTYVALFWIILLKPEFLPMTVAFLFGLFRDLTMFAPLGISSFIYVLTWWSITSQSRFLYGQSVLMHWLIFGVLTIGLTCIQWLLSFVTNGQAPLSIAPYLHQILSTTLLFPLISYLWIKPCLQWIIEED